LQLQEEVFSVGSLQRLYWRYEKQLSLESMEREYRQTDHSKFEAVVRQSPTSKCVNMEAEEAMALEAVARQLAKAQPTEKT
jgi:hypothetical protein